jgi:uncharacterized membrane protein
MKLANTLCKALGIIVLLTIILGVFSVPIAEASTKSAPAITEAAIAADSGPKVAISTQYPILSGSATTTFTFQVDLQYTGAEDKKVFNLAVKGPAQYTYSIQQSIGGDINIGAIELDPKKGYADTIKVSATPNLRNTPKPGEYPLTLEVSAGTLKYTIDLKVNVTARYSIRVTTPDGLLNTNAEAGKDNYFYFTVTNLGDSAMNQVKFHYNIRGVPQNWRVTFKPESLSTLEPNIEQKIEMNIKPAEKAIPGDYEINLSVDNDAQNASDSLSVRVTVLSSTIWGWLGVIIVVVVVLALVVIFIKFGRR